MHGARARRHPLPPPGTVIGGAGDGAAYNLMGDNCQDRLAVRPGRSRRTAPHAALAARPSTSLRTNGGSLSLTGRLYGLQTCLHVRHPDEGQDPFDATIMVLAWRGSDLVAIPPAPCEWIPASAGMTKRDTARPCSRAIGISPRGRPWGGFRLRIDLAPAPVNPLPAPSFQGGRKKEGEGGKGRNISPVPCDARPRGRRRCAPAGRCRCARHDRRPRSPRRRPWSAGPPARPARSARSRRRARR